MTLHFVWNVRKAVANARKHGVAFEEALSVFADPLERIHDDPAHSDEEEEREIIVGHSALASFWYPSHSLASPSASSMPGERHVMSASSTKKPRPSRRRPRGEGDLARDYQFDYGRSRPNRCAGQVSEDAVVVVLDEDVAAVFRDPKRVNALLRATIAALHGTRRKRAG